MFFSANTPSYRLMAGYGDRWDRTYAYIFSLTGLHTVNSGFREIPCVAEINKSLIGGVKPG